MNLWQVQVVNRPGDRDLLSLMIGETYERQIRDIFFWYLGVGQFESPCFFFPTQLERLGPCTVGKPSSHVDLDAGAAWASASERQ